MSDLGRKTIYVCRQNIGRSQMAMEFHNRIQPGTADSAGFNVDNPGQTIEDWEGSAVVLNAMREIGIDMSQNQRRQLTRDEMHKYGRLVILSEVGVIQTYIFEHPHWLRWEIPDPKGRNLENTRVIRDAIQERVTSFIEGELS